MTLSPDQAHRLAGDLLAADDPVELHPPTILGFELGACIGSGGMGVVYEAEQEAPRRKVAIKIVRPELVDVKSARRLEHEAELAARLRHPNVARVYTAGVYSHGGLDIPYVVLERIPDALPIDRYIEHQRFDLRARLELFVQACDGIHDAHLHGVIHRDIKPANLLVDDSSGSATVKVIDFGVARALDADVAPTWTTDVPRLVGTLKYMSPEQTRGTAAEVDSRSDVYSLGVVLYEIVCGRAPYPVDSTNIAGVAASIQTCAPTPPRGVNPKIARDLEAVILMSLAKRADDRYPSAAALGDDIRRFLSRQPVVARAPSLFSRMLDATKAHPILATGITSAAIAALLTIAAALAVMWSMARIVGDVRLLASGRQAAVLRPDGEEIHRWSASDGAISYATIVWNPRRNGDRSVLLGLSADSHLIGLPKNEGGALLAYRFGEWNSPWWHRCVDDEVLASVPHPSYPTTGPFEVSFLRVLDLIPRGGDGTDEILAIHKGQPASLIRVYGSSGDVRFQAWHDGVVSFGAWLPEASQLVFIGTRSSDPAEQQVPRQVIFGLSLESAVPIAGPPVDPSANALWPPESVAWYGCVPTEWTDRFSERTTIRVSEVDSGRDRDRTVKVAVVLDNRPNVNFSWEFDAQGEFVPDSIVPSDAWRASGHEPRPFVLVRPPFTRSADPR